MKATELRKKSNTELIKLANKLRQQINELHRDKLLKEVKNVRDIRNRRRDLARVLTVLNEKTKSDDTNSRDDKKTTTKGDK